MILQTVLSLNGKTKTDAASWDREVSGTQIFPFCMKLEREAQKEGSCLDNIRLSSVRGPVLLCYTQTGVWERSVEEEKVQHLRTVCLIPNVDSWKSYREHHGAKYSCSNIFPPLCVALCPWWFPRDVHESALKTQRKRNVAEYLFIQTTSHGIFNGRRPPDCGKLSIL